MNGTYVLSVGAIPVGAYSELERAKNEAANRAAPNVYPAPAIEWTAESVDGGDHDRWTSDDCTIRYFYTNTGDHNPFTGDLVISINDTPAAPFEAGVTVVAEILAHIGASDFQQLQFTFIVEDHPALYLDGPGEILAIVDGYASGNYPRLGAEWCQI